MDNGQDINLRFEKVHKRIDEIKDLFHQVDKQTGEQGMQIDNIEKSVSCISDNLKSMREEQREQFSKNIKTIAVIVGIISAAIGVIFKLIES